MWTIFNSRTRHKSSRRQQRYSASPFSTASLAWCRSVQVLVRSEKTIRWIIPLVLGRKSKISRASSRKWLPYFDSWVRSSLARKVQDVISTTCRSSIYCPSTGFFFMRGLCRTKQWGLWTSLQILIGSQSSRTTEIFCQPVGKMK